MDALFAYYTDKFRKIDGTIFEVFGEFYSADISPIDAWLESQFEKKVIKDNKVSTLYRQQGNKYYAKKDLLKSLEFYTRSLCWATPFSKEYGLAVANRSAVTFEMKEFENCLGDIDLCLKTNYPPDLKPKVYIRKAECLFELGYKELLKSFISEMLIYFKTESVTDKAKYIARLKQIDEFSSKANLHTNKNEYLYEIPNYSDAESTSFSNASSKIRMGYDKSRGRHVIAKMNIKRGEILFVEKAFSFAPVFKECKEFHPLKCYYCLRDIISGVPCKTCVLCIYCNEQCRNTSWNECHMWECNGMQANIWYDLGIAFPAFKTMMKGVLSGFINKEGGFDEDVKHFGSKTDNYPYFNRLLSNIYKSKNAAPYVVMSSIVISYLRKYTDFFTWYIKQPSCPKQEQPGLIKYLGGVITKHIAQLASNSCIIEHWTSSSSELLFPDVLISIACGIFPSVSIMNHSCRSNVTNYFICDTIVVKALEDIRENDEIFNCYGIDYRGGMSRDQRQTACRNLYHFECKCVICLDPSKELDMLDSYSCPKCKGLIPDMLTTPTSFCINCGEKYPLSPFKKMNKEAQKYLEKDSSDPLVNFLKCLQIREKILYKHHKDFEEVFYKLYSYYVEIGDSENMFRYFHQWLKNEKARRGENARGIGTKLYEAALAILHCLQSGQPKNCVNLKEFLQNVEYMIKEAKAILNLYYPIYITDRLSSKIQFISTKS